VALESSADKFLLGSAIRSSDRIELGAIHFAIRGLRTFSLSIPISPLAGSSCYQVKLLPIPKTVSFATPFPFLVLYLSDTGTLNAHRISATGGIDPAFNFSLEFNPHVKWFEMRTNISNVIFLDAVMATGSSQVFAKEYILDPVTGALTVVPTSDDNITDSSGLALYSDARLALATTAGRD